MYLYDKTKDMIDVYTMKSNNQKSAEFKKSEIESTIPFEERILRASTNDEKELEKKAQPILLSKIQRENVCGESFWHKVDSYQMSDEEKIRQEKLLNDFFNGEFSDKSIALIQEYIKENSKFEIIKYFLLTKPYEECNGQYVMNDIISLPKSLYLLQLLEQGHFHKVADEDINSQLQLFDISQNPVERISINELKKMYASQLLPGSFETVMYNVETTQKILRKVK